MKKVKHLQIYDVCRNHVLSFVCSPLPTLSGDFGVVRAVKLLECTDIVLSELTRGRLKKVQHVKESKMMKYIRLGKMRVISKEQRGT